MVGPATYLRLRLGQVLALLLRAQERLLRRVGFRQCVCREPYRALHLRSRRSCRRLGPISACLGSACVTIEVQVAVVVQVEFLYVAGVLRQ